MTRLLSKIQALLNLKENGIYFYTARGKEEYTIGYVAADSLQHLQTAPRYKLKNLGGRTSAYAAAPQVFYFKPQKTWYLIFQTRDSNYQPVYSTTKTIELPDSWSQPLPLIKKEDKTKWIDFWILCDNKTAYMYYTRGHKDVYVMSTSMNAFPNGFSNARKVFSPVHESVHVYKVSGIKKYHMFYELSETNGLRHFGLATAEQPLGPWKIKNNHYAMKNNLTYTDPATKWTEEVSHGELLRSNYDQNLEYNPDKTTFLIQGLLEKDHKGSYENLPWKLGFIQKIITE